MRANTRRLRWLEERMRPPGVPVIDVFFHDDLVPCSQHRNCDVDRETGAHHTGVIRLRFKKSTDG